ARDLAVTYGPGERGPENREITIRAILTPPQRLSIIRIQPVARFATRRFGSLFQPLLDAGAGKLFNGNRAKHRSDHRIDDLPRDVCRLAAVERIQVILARIQYRVIAVSRDHTG